MENTSTTDVLIVGAGPTGLILALQLVHHGISFRIIDKNLGPGQFSRAMAIHARTLEFYKQMGIADEVIDLGIRVSEIHWLKEGKETAQLQLNNVGEHLSPYPYMLSFPQDEHEQFLVNTLKKAGVDIEWNTELISFSDRGDVVQVSLKKGDTEEMCEVPFLCGCDGAHSAVRKGLQIDFAGGKYDQLFYVADVKTENEMIPKNDISLFINDVGFCGIFPIRTSGSFRIIGIIPKELAGCQSIQFEDILPYIEETVTLNIKKINWFSTYQSHHRIAKQFRKGRAFLLGDAGHIHSPAGGQGMNTGIGDAINLGWKLAGVLQQKTHDTILNTYEQERLAFAKLLVSTTDTAFRNLIGDNLTGKLFRNLFFPYILPALLKFPFVRRQMFNLLSQTRIHYRHSTLSQGTAGKIRGGDRLPWFFSEHHDNFSALTSQCWQIHVYGEVSEPLQKYAQSTRLPIHHFPWDHNVKSELIKDALYLIRPDGYIGLAQENQNISSLKNYLEQHRIKTSPQNQESHKA